MNAEIISIGTEITTGNTLNTNSKFIAEKLLDLGIETLYQTSVDDNVDRMKEVFDIALNRVDLVITTGGLGPTEDDLTKEIWADYLGLEIYQDDEMTKIIENKFKNRNMSNNNYKQANTIEGSKFLFNEVGTAPGTFLEYDGKIIILLPGPPREIEPMFINEVIPLLEGEDLKILTESISLTGLGESQLESEILDLIHGYDDLEIATFGRIQNVEIRIIARGNDLDSLKKQIDQVILEIEKRYPDNIYSYNGRPIENVVFNLLEEKNLKIGFAESCTGGLVSGKFSRMAGVSKVFDRTLVTYSNNAKIEELNVKKETLKEFGAVSKETSKEMVFGLLNREDIDIGASITGLLGPKSDGTNKPIGLVYISVSNGKDTITKELNLTGDRKNLQDRVVEHVFFLIREFLIKNY